MNSKDKFEIAFMSLLIVIIVGLALICLNPNYSTDMYASSQNSYSNNEKDYKILDKTEICAEAIEEFYSDANYTYYFNCIRSGSIYLEWDNGEVSLMKDDLNSGKVTITSLFEHGLNASKRPIINTLEENINEN